MPTAREQLNEIEQWARATFPEAFRVTKTSIRRNGFWVLKDDQNDCADRKDGQAVLRIGKIVGRTYPIYAYIREDTASVAYYYSMVERSGSGTKHPMSSLHKVKFLKSLAWLGVDGNFANDKIHETKIGALLQYLSLVFDRPLIGAYNADTFKNDFKRACHAVSECLAEDVHPSGTLENSIILRTW